MPLYLWRSMYSLLQLRNNIPGWFCFAFLPCFNYYEILQQKLVEMVKKLLKIKLFKFGHPRPILITQILPWIICCVCQLYIKMSWTGFIWWDHPRCIVWKSMAPCQDQIINPMIRKWWCGIMSICISCYGSVVIQGREQRWFEIYLHYKGGEAGNQST